MPVKVWHEGQHKETEAERKLQLQKNAQRMALPYEAKVNMAKRRIREWADMCYENGKNYAVSVGGLDSITLLTLCRETLKEDVQGISVSVLEDKSIQAVHRELGVIPIKPIKSKVQVLQEDGFPVNPLLKPKPAIPYSFLLSFIQGPSMTLGMPSLGL